LSLCRCDFVRFGLKECRDPSSREAALVEKTVVKVLQFGVRWKRSVREVVLLIKRARCHLPARILQERKARLSDPEQTRAERSVSSSCGRRVYAWRSFQDVKRQIDTRFVASRNGSASNDVREAEKKELRVTGPFIGMPQSLVQAKTDTKTI
jgi:hypothetical protein